MLAFSLENLRNVDRIVIRREPAPLPKIGEVIERPYMYARLYIGDEQVALGALRQENARDGEFTVDMSGRRLLVMFLEAITEQKFKEHPFEANVQEFHRAK